MSQAQALALALLVGLKSVDPAHYGGKNYAAGCEGCEADVDSMDSILRPLHYDITPLKTEKATRKAILGWLDGASQRLRDGDILIFYYSGHGGQLPDDNGDEPDQQDETLMVRDGRIRDDELNQIWLRLKPGVRVVMISDSCNAGTNHKMMRESLRCGSVAPATGPVVPGGMRAQMIHLGGSRDGEAASGGYPQGSPFTLVLREVWARGTFVGSYADFHCAISEMLAKYRPQEPQMNEYGPVTPAFRAQKPFTR